MLSHVSSQSSSQSLSNHIDIKKYDVPYPIGHSHEYHQITIPLAGTINTLINDNCIQVSYGQALIIAKHTFHRFYANKTSRFLIIDIEDTPNLLFDKMGMANFENYLHFHLDEKTLLFINVIEKQINSGSNPKVEQIMLALLTELIQSMQTHDRSDPRLSAVINLIKQDLSINHSIASLAKVACLSESQFKVVFKQQLGCTPFEYMTELRMQLALHLILNSSLPIYRIAQNCGYNSVSAFIRRFNKVYQRTPSKLRHSGNKVTP